MCKSSRASAAGVSVGVGGRSYIQAEHVVCGRGGVLSDGWQEADVCGGRLYASRRCVGGLWMKDFLTPFFLSSLNPDGDQNQERSRPGQNLRFTDFHLISANAPGWAWLYVQLIPKSFKCQMAKKNRWIRTLRTILSSSLERLELFSICKVQW